jgi:ribose transport system substrate-binding protein
MHAASSSAKTGTDERVCRFIWDLLGFVGAGEASGMAIYFAPVRENAMSANTQRVTFIAVSVSLFALAGCGSPAHEPDEKYFLVATNTKVSYWQSALAGLGAAGSQLNVKTEMAGPETYDTKAEQQEFQRVVKLKPSGILLSAGDAKLMQGDVDAAIAQGVPVITIDSDVEGSKRLFFIGTDNYKAGTMGAKVLQRELHGKGNVVVYTMPDQPNLRERLHGYEDALTGNPQIKIIRVADIKGSATLAFDTTKEILDAGSGKVDAFVCLESLGCAEVADVLDRRHVMKKVVIAMDTSPNTLEWIQKGGINATIGQKPFTMAFYGVKMLDDLHHHKVTPLDGNWAQDSFSPIPSFVDTGETLIDKSNVDAFVKKLAETKK